MHLSPGRNASHDCKPRNRTQRLEEALPGTGKGMREHFCFIGRSLSTLISQMQLLLDTKEKFHRQARQEPRFHE